MHFYRSRSDNFVPKPYEALADISLLIFYFLQFQSEETLKV